jgi:multidrug efflux pump subunit AcrA (membrane-fusion protein)
MKIASWTDPNGQTYQRFVEAGVPDGYAQQGITTVAQYQTAASQDLSDKQIAAQQKIADQQQAFNQQQADQQKAQYDQQIQQARDQATRQSEYDTGRAKLLGEGTQQVNDAFSKFSPDYFNQYAKDYMSKAQDDISYQRNIAQKNLGFQLARQGISSSQAGVNQEGLIDENAGRATALQTANAQSAENTLQGNVAAAKQNLLGQVTSSESIGSPIAGSSEQDVNAALNTQKSAISGVSSQAGDVTSSLAGVPTVSPLSNIFANVLGSAGSYLGGLQSNVALGAYQRAAAGGGPVAPGPNQNSAKTSP